MKNNNIFSKIISRENYPKLIFGILCFILLLPIIILPPQFQPSDWTRASLFKTTVAILIALFLYRFFYKKDLSFSVPKKGYLFYLPMLTLSAYFIVLIIATIFSDDTTFSFFGSPARASGLLNMLFFLAFVFFMALFIKGELWNKLIRINFIAGSFASVLAIVQYFGLLKNIFLSSESGATPSLLGNSTFLAIYMIFLAFCAFAFFLSQENKRKKTVYGGLFLLFLFTIFVTSSRASYIGVLMGFAFYFLLFPKKLSEGEDRLVKWITRERIKILKISSFIFIFLIISLVVYVNMIEKLPDFIENNKKLSFFIQNRLSVENAIRDLTGTRLSTWKITLKAIQEKPFLGWGPENFHIGFEKYFDPTLPPSLARLWLDRPHNIFLEILVNSGIFALIFYIAFWAILLWQLQVFKNKNENKKEVNFAHSLQAMFIAYLTVLFFNFDSFSTYLISFFFIGYALYLISSKDGQITITPMAKPMPFAKPTAFIFLSVIALFVWFWNIKPLYLNEKIVLIDNLSESKQCKKALSLTNNSNWEKAGIIKAYAALKHSDAIKKCTYIQPEKEAEYAQKSLSLLKKASESQPKYSRTWLFMGAFGNVLAAREENNKENKNKMLLDARDYLHKALELSPKRQEIFAELQKNYLLAEDYASMEKLAQDCINIDSSQGFCYWYLGIAQIFMGDQENGKKNIGLSKEKYYNDPSYLQLGAAYISQKNYKDAVDAYRLLTSIYPDKVSYHATLALLYKEIGEFERAVEGAKTVFKLQPENPETIEFLKIFIGLKPGDISLHYALVDIYKTLGYQEKHRAELLKIKSIYLQLISQRPREPDYHLNLAYVYRELGEFEKAYQEAITTIELNIKKIKEVESLLQLLPSKFIDLYLEYLKSNPDKYFEVYGHDIYGQYPKKK